jgi:hypothetical protein
MFFLYIFRVPKNSEITFQFVVVKSSNNSVVDREIIPPRVIVIEDQQAVLEAIYNCSSMIGQEGNILLLIYMVQADTENQTSIAAALAHNHAHSSKIPTMPPSHQISENKQYI